MTKILIADDELPMRTLLKELLEEFEDKGVELLTAENGEETIESIKAEKPELVILEKNHFYHHCSAFIHIYICAKCRKQFTYHYIAFECSRNASNKSILPISNDTII